MRHTEHLPKTNDPVISKHQLKNHRSISQLKLLERQLLNATTKKISEVEIFQKLNGLRTG